MALTENLPTFHTKSSSISKFNKLQFEEVEK